LQDRAHPRTLMGSPGGPKLVASSSATCNSCVASSAGQISLRETESLEFTLQRASSPPGGGSCQLSPLASSQGTRSTLKRELQQSRLEAELQRQKKAVGSATQSATLQNIRCRRKAAQWQWLRKCELSLGTGQLYRLETRPKTKPSRLAWTSDQKVDMRFREPLYFESAKPWGGRSASAYTCPAFHASCLTEPSF
jgi:hypothetical protein